MCQLSDVSKLELGTLCNIDSLLEYYYKPVINLFQCAGLVDSVKKMLW